MNTFLINAFSGLPTRIWLLALVNLINRSGGMILCFLTLYLTQSLHYSIKDAGFAMAFLGVGSICGGLLGGRLTDKFGYQNIQLLSLLGSGVAFLGLLFVRDFWLMCIALFCCNLVGEAFRPANAVAVRMNSDPDNRTRAYSLLRLAFNLAISFALVIGGWLISKGWYLIFWADALTCFAAAATLFFFVPNIRNQEKEAAIAEDKAATETKTADFNTKNPELMGKVVPKNNSSAYTDAPFLFFIGLTFLSALVFMQIIWTLPAFFKNVYGWNELLIGAMSAVNGITVMLVEMPMVFGIEGKRKNLWFVRLGVGLYALSYAVLVLPNEYRWFAALFYMIVISFGEILAMPFSTTWAMARASATQQGQYMALYGVAYSTANIVAPIFGTQIIATYGYHTLWVCMAVIAVFTSIGFFFLSKMTEAM
jgi:predicted MFS family arabinose efflux permease